MRHIMLTLTGAGGFITISKSSSLRTLSSAFLKSAPVKAIPSILMSIVRVNFFSIALINASVQGRQLDGLPFLNHF